MVKIYIVTGRADENGYHETFYELDMHDKPLSYTTVGRRINKNEVNIIRDGLIKGSYELISPELDKINQARIDIKNKVRDDKEAKLEAMVLTLEKVYGHEFCDLETLAKL
jgi:hypothetical protein